ncbi:hypothetical protein [Paraglaciecola aestuariivivens]
MKFLSKTTISLSLTLALIGCGGGSSESVTPIESSTPTPSPAIKVETLAGIYSGKFATGGEEFEVDGIVAPSGEIRFITSLDEQLKGIITITDSGFSVDPLSSFISDGYLSDDYYASVFNTNGSATGTIDNGKLSGTTTLDGNTASFVLDKEEELTEFGASFDKLTGNYVTPDFSTSISFDADGKINGVDDYSCVYSGEMTIPNVNVNVYEMSVIVENCEDGNGTYKGLASVIPAGTIEGIDTKLVLFQADNELIAITAALIEN